MRVNGYTVPVIVEQACLRRMNETTMFRSSDIAHEARLKMLKVGDGCADRRCQDCTLCDTIAARLIQRERRAKRIQVARYPWWEVAR